MTIKIYLQNGRNRYGKLSLSPNIEFIEDEKKADIRLLSAGWRPDSPCYKKADRTIFFMKYINGRKRSGIRTGYFVDDKLNFPPVKNFCFSANDFSDPRIINFPVGFNRGVWVSKPDMHWQDVPRHNNIKCFNKVYWRGQIANHESRNQVVEYFQDKPLFDVAGFNHFIYRNPISSDIHDEHLEKLATSDMCFNLRGDRPSTHTFLEMIQYGCIPININCQDVGWEKIMNVNDYMLQFDLRTQSLEHIHREILSVLENKKQILKMKNNCVNLFETLFRKSGQRAWEEFIISKCVEIYKNDFDITKVDNAIISPDIFEIKGIENSL